MTTGYTDCPRPPELDEIYVHHRGGGRWVTCFCAETIFRSIVPHLKKEHPDKWTEWTRLFVRLRALGHAPKRIMRDFSDRNGNILFSWTVVERSIRDAVESNIEPYSPPRKKRITEWEPEGFQLETTMIWDFPRRGSWGVHRGDYRGNWPPQLVRNLVQRHSCRGGLIVDPFMGGGTTLLESWLLRRKSVGLDISNLAVQTTTGRLKELEEKAGLSGEIGLDPAIRPIVIKGNALNLREIMDGIGVGRGGISLACLHPPYLNAIQYTKDDEDDLSRIDDPKEFARRMGYLAEELSPLLKPDGLCALLMGDVRKDGRLVPLGQETMDQFKKAKFELQDIIIKVQHRDRSSEFYVRSDSGRMLLAHEYLFILRKPRGT